MSDVAIQLRLTAVVQGLDMDCRVAGLRPSSRSDAMPRCHRESSTWRMRQGEGARTANRTGGSGGASATPLE